MLVTVGLSRHDRFGASNDGMWPLAATDYGDWRQGRKTVFHSGLTGDGAGGWKDPPRAVCHALNGAVMDLAYQRPVAPPWP